MPTQTARALPSETLDALSALYTRTVDAKAGFDKMAEHAEPGFRPTVARFQDLHARHAARLATLLTEAGREPEGSLMGTVNRTVVGLRALFDQIDSDVASEIRSGEDHVMTAFDEAIRHSAGEPIRSELSRMRDELAALVAGRPNED